MILDAASPSFQRGLDNGYMTSEQELNERARRFYHMLNDSEVPLYDRYEKHTILLAITKILHFKIECDFIERAIDDIFTLIKEFLPMNDKFSGSYYEVKKIVKKLNLII